MFAGAADSPGAREAYGDMLAAAASRGLAPRPDGQPVCRVSVGFAGLSEDQARAVLSRGALGALEESCGVRCAVAAGGDGPVLALECRPPSPRARPPGSLAEPLERCLGRVSGALGRR